MSTSSDRPENVPLFKTDEASYPSIQQAARLVVELKNIIKTATHQSISLKERLANLESALVDRRSPPRTDLQRIYAAVGVELPGTALRRFEEVEVFHASVLANRRIHLAPEIEWVKARIDALDRQAAEADRMRSEILRQLDERL